MKMEDPANRGLRFIPSRLSTRRLLFEKVNCNRFSSMRNFRFFEKKNVRN